MQCALTSKVSTVNPPKPRVRSTQPSIVQKQISLQKKFENHDELSLCVNLPLPSHVKSITSTSNPFVKHCQKLLHSSSYRHSNVTVLVVGATPIRFLANSSLINWFHLIFLFWVFHVKQFFPGMFTWAFSVHLLGFQK